MASASARIVATNDCSITSGLSTPAPAMAGPEMPIPKPAPIADSRTLSPAPRLAQNVGQVKDQRRPLVWHNPAHRFLIRRECVAGPFIKLTKPFYPVKPQRLHKHDQSF